MVWGGYGAVRGLRSVGPLCSLALRRPPVAEHLIAQHSAIKMLHSRVRLILEYVRAAESGEGGAGRGGGGVEGRGGCIKCPPPPFVGAVPFNHEILREACALCHCLPVLSTDKFKTDFYDVRGANWGGCKWRGGLDLQGGVGELRGGLQEGGEPKGGGDPWEGGRGGWMF